MDVSAATWNTLSKLLDEALELEPGVRAAWIDGIDATQPELGPVLRKLLAAHASSETADLLQRLPPVDAPAISGTAAAGLSVGSRVGPYKLKRELGSGGMADVWLAERADGAFEREVALKLPRLSRLRRDLAARFARERDILARLEHPHIARFYDAGVTTDGLPYLAIEYVDGQPIVQWCDEHKLDIAARLRLFAQVLEAVQFAHANLVIHRDLKPSNILVTEDGQVRLLDFGIAKLLSDEEIAHETRLTQFAGRVLTPDYASPEQIKGEPLTTATDVYSLGVVMYELLAGSRPYKLKLQSVAQLEQAIITADPLRPSTNFDSESAPPARRTTARRLAGALAGDIDTIVLKAIAKAPAARYATIGALAQDIERHLRREPISARADSAGYRLYKLITRNRLALAAIAGVFVSLAAGLAAALWQAQEAKEQARLAQQAVGRHEGVRQLYVELLSTITGWDAETFAQPRSIATLLTQKLEELKPQYAQRPEDWAGILNAASVQLSYMGEFEAALNVATQYLEVLKQTRADTRSIVFAHITASRALRNLGRLAQGEQILREGLSWIPQSTDPALLQLRVFVLSELGPILALNGKRGEAKALLQAVRPIAEKHFPNDTDYADLLQNMGRLELGFDSRAALALIEDARRVYLASGYADITQIALNLLYLGSAYLDVGRLTDAETNLSEARAKLTELFGAADHDTQHAVGLLASVLNRQERYSDAVALLDPALTALSDQTDQKSRAITVALSGQRLEGALLAGDIPAAERTLSTIVDPNATHPNARNTLVLPLARVQYLLWTGRADEAQQQIEVLRASLARSPAPVDAYRIEVAAVQLILARQTASAADEAATALLDTLRRDGATGSWIFVVAHEWAALAAAASGNTDRALNLLRAIDADGAGVSIAPPSRVERAESDLRRAQVLMTIGHRAEARERALSALEDLAAQHPNSPRLRQARSLLASTGQ